MKKNYLFGFFAMATMLFTASCQEQEVVQQGQAGADATVSINVTTPELGVSTRAFGDGMTAQTLHYAVYNVKGEGENRTRTYLDELTVEDHTFELSTQIDLQLVTGNTYDVIFWADTDGNAPYSIDWSNGIVSVDYSNVTSNNEDYDAFFNWITIEVNGAQTESVKLYRPFGQLNIGTSDIEEARKAGYVIAQTSVTVPTYETLNLWTKEVSGETTVTFDPANIPANETFPVAGYEYLAMNYLLLPVDKELVEVVFDFYSTEDEPKNRVYSSVPLRRNWRTNIYGQLMTSDIDVNIDIEPLFKDQAGEPNSIYNIEVWDGTVTEEDAPVITTDENGNDVAVVSTGSQLAYVAQMLNGGFANNAPATRAGEVDYYQTITIVLDTDLDLGNEEWLPVGTSSTPFKGTFDGNGFTIHNLKVTGYESNVGLFGVTHDGEIKNLILNNANVSGRLNVGAVAGQPYTSKYTNITVKGHVEVNGMAYVGAVGGKNAYADWTNITVDVDATSYVKANSVENGTTYRTYVGGVVGFNGEGSHTFKDITSNINVQGSTCDVGGLFGIAHYDNKFENCECTGNVEIYAAEEAEEAQEIGGIAGVWHNETGTSVTFTNCSFEGNLTTNIEGVNYYYNGLVGKPYSANGAGKLIIDGEVAVASVEALQTAINDAAEGETTIALYADMVGNVTVVQKEGINITINGREHKFDGVITVNGNARATGQETLTFKNIKFENDKTDGIAKNEDDFTFISAPSKIDGRYNYSHNVTIEDCTFNGKKDVGSANFTGTYNLVMKNCTATNMHSILQVQSCDNTVLVEEVATVDCKSGISFGNTAYPTLKNSTIEATEYGVRADGNASRGNLVIENTAIKAEKPVIVRKMTTSTYNVKLEGTTLENSGEYAVVFTNGSDDEEYVKPTGTYTLTGADNYLVYPRDYYTPVASWDEFTAALAAGDQKIKLTADIEYASNYQLQKSIVLNLDGHSMTLPMVNIHTTTTVKNGTINGKVYARKNSDITFDNVTFSGAVSDNLSTEGHLAIQGGCKVYAKNCLFSPTSVSGSQTKPLSFEGGSSILKFEGCEFKSSPYKKQVYLNSLSATGSIDFTNCNFNNKTPNIMFAAACPLTNVTMSGTTKLSSVTFEINRAKEALTESDLAYLRTLINNNSFSSVRVFYAGGSSEYIR